MFIFLFFFFCLSLKARLFSFHQLSFGLDFFYHLFFLQIFFFLNLPVSLFLDGFLKKIFISFILQKLVLFLSFFLKILPLILFSNNHSFSYLIEHNRHFCLHIFVNPFELPHQSHDIRRELVDKSSIISHFLSTFCSTLGHHQLRMYYKSDVTFVCT